MTIGPDTVGKLSNEELTRQLAGALAERDELQAQQAATGSILKEISRSTFDLTKVLQSLLDSAMHLGKATSGGMFLPESDGGYRMAVLAGEGPQGSDPALEKTLRDRPIRPGRDTTTGLALLERRTVHTPDINAMPGYRPDIVAVGAYRTNLAVPMLRDGEVVGVIVLTRGGAVLPFTDKQIELIETFAAQAVIAIGNVRLFNELRDSLERLKAAQDNLIQAEKLASLGQLTAGIAHEIKNPLNFVNNFADLSAELVGELRGALDPAKTELGAEARADVDELTEMLAANLAKVSQHGRRADSIVKNMLLHSREGGGERRRVDLNASVEESLNLAYHGARAEKPGFNMTLEKDLDPALGEVELYPQEFVRVLLNLISNGFYAAHQRKIDSADAAFEPTLRVTTRARGDHAEIRIRDNGTGIPDSVKEKIFNPFFTTKPAGEGTGLGLSLSFDIVVKQHGGTLDVETEPGTFTEFVVTVPRQLAAGAAPAAVPSP